MTTLLSLFRAIASGPTPSAPARAPKYARLPLP
jgi:hypothetical protein